MRWVAAAALGVLLLPVLVIGAALGGIGSDRAPATAWGGRSEALADIPPAFLALYVEAAGRFGVPVGVLAAVGKVECDHGRHPACDTPNAAGAVGPMQFLPSTFAAYASASGNPSPSILDPRDAVFAAAAKLAADGVATDPAAAIYAYNHSAAYVAQVVAWAVAYGWVAPPAVLGRAVLDHPSLTFLPEAAGDVRAGLVDGRVLAVLLVLATTHRLDDVGPFVTGHSTYVAGTDRVSNHASGRAADLAVVDGVPVSATNAGARDVVDQLIALAPGLRPDEVGGPWPLDIPGVRTFTEGHSDHIHYGYDA